jgi:hypothetical protein
VEEKQPASRKQLQFVEDKQPATRRHLLGQHIGSRLSTVAVFWKHVADILHPSSVVFWQHGGFLLPTVSLLTVDCFTSSTICIYFLEAD